MSPSLVDDTAGPDPGRTSKRSSVDKVSRKSTDLAMSGSTLKQNGKETINGVKTNGNPQPNGVVNSLRSVVGLPNGLSHQDTMTEKENKDRDSRTTPSLNNLSRPSTVIDMENGDVEQDRKPHRLAPRDDGYFAEVPLAESEAFLGSSTNVTLNVGSGHLPSRPGSTSSRRHEPPKHDEDPDRIAPGRPSESSVAEGSRSNQPHRISSPPALQESSTSLSAIQPGKLQQRHTLEVPRPSASRVSRETARTADEVYTSGRFSPTSNAPSRRRGSINLVRRVTRSAHSDVHLDEQPQSEDAEKWAEIIRQKRASKRRRDDYDDERVVMGTKVDQNHVNYVTAYNMLTGIRFTVSRTNAKLDRDLEEADFDARHKFSFDITGNELTPSAKYDFKFKDYAPWVFRHLRSIFRLDPADYLMSLTSKYILSELGSPGKSGSFFYFSRDYKYIIKTIHHAEHKLLRKILRQYYYHVKDNPNTLLSQFYGLHRVKIPYGRKIHFVVMNNLFPPHRDIHQTFDLKGSTIGRNFKEEDLEKNPRATLKDLNWLRRNMHIELGPEKKHKFLEQMHRDVQLLQKLKIMDYSLLVGIHDLSRGNEDKLRDKTLQVFQPGGGKIEEPAANTLMRTPSKLESQRKANELRVTLMHERPVPMNQTMDKMPDEMDQPQRKDFYFYHDDGGFRATHEDDSAGEVIYYLGIIDCLTHYGFVKRLEHFWKGLNHTESQISAIPPDRYGDRFCHFISGLTMSREAAASAANPASPPMRSPAEEQVLAPAERVAERSARHGPPEQSVPDRNLSSVRSPPQQEEQYTLPVVEEAAENSSVGGRSASPGDGMGREGEPKCPTRRPPLTPPEMAERERALGGEGLKEA